MSCLPSTVGMSLQALLLKTGKVPYPTNHWHLCRCLQALSLVLRLDNYKAYRLTGLWASLVAQRLKRLPAMRETWVWSQGREDPLEKEMATHSSILAWRIPWAVEPGGVQSTGSQRVRHDWATSLSFTGLWSAAQHALSSKGKDFSRGYLDSCHPDPTLVPVTWRGNSNSTD